MAMTSAATAHTCRTVGPSAGSRAPACNSFCRGLGLLLGRQAACAASFALIFLSLPARHGFRSRRNQGDAGKTTLTGLLPHAMIIQTPIGPSPGTVPAFSAFSGSASDAP